MRRAAADGAAVFAAPELGTIEVAGGDRKSWLNGLLTSDVSQVRPGVASYGLAVVKIGRILSDLWVLDAADRVLVGAPRARVSPLREHFERYLVMEDATHEDASSAWAWMHAHGPAAADVLAEAARAHAGFSGAFDLLGAGGAVLAVPAAAREAALATLGARAGVTIGSAEAWDLFRTERAFPRFGVDYGDQNYPQEASLEKLAVSFNKGCYLGQEVVCRLEMRGHVSKKLVPIRLDGPAPERGAEVTTDDGKAIGTVSSAVPDGRGGALALAMMRYAFSEPGTRVKVAGREASVGGP